MPMINREHKDRHVGVKCALLLVDVHDIEQDERQVVLHPHVDDIFDRCKVDLFWVCITGLVHRII